MHCSTSPEFGRRELSVNYRSREMQKVARTLLSVALAIGVVSATRSNAQDGRPNPGAVFIMTNAADRNEVISFRRAADGSLQEGRRFATGGRGSGGNNDPLESQGSLT